MFGLIVTAGFGAARAGTVAIAVLCEADADKGLDGHFDIGASRAGAMLRLPAPLALRAMRVVRRLQQMIGDAHPVLWCEMVLRFSNSRVCPVL